MLSIVHVSHNLAATIRNAAALYDIAYEDLMAIARIESAFKTDAKNPHSTAKGLFQFIDATARRYGIDPMDPTQASGAAALMAYQNRIHLIRRAHLGMSMNLYLAHQQGPGRAATILDVALGDGHFTARDKRVMELNLPQPGRGLFLKEDTDAHKAQLFLDVWADKFAAAGKAWKVDAPED